MINQVLYNKKPVPQVNFIGADDFSEIIRASFIGHSQFWEAVIFNQEDVKLGEGKSLDDFREFVLNYSVGEEMKYPVLVKYGPLDQTGSKSKFNFKYIVITFDGEEANGSMPLMMRNDGQPALAGFGMMPGMGMPPGGYVTQDQLQGIVDKNVGDVQRSLRAEFDEQNSKNNADNYRQKIEYEIRLIEFQLELKKSELDKKEADVDDKLMELKKKHDDSMGNLKDYTQAIAGGIMEIGKGYLGIKGRGLAGADDTKEPVAKPIVNEDTQGFNAIDEQPETEADPNDESEEELDLEGFAGSLSDDEATELNKLLNNRNQKEALPEEPIQAEEEKTEPESSENTK